MRWRFQVLGIIAGLALGGCGQPAQPLTAHYKPVSHWIAALQSPDAKLRLQAARVLGNVGPNDPAVIPALAGALADTDVAVRLEAVIGLMKIGPTAKEAIPALEQATKDKDAKVRGYAGKALERVRGS